MRGAATLRRGSDAGRAIRLAEEREREATAEAVRLRRVLDALTAAVVVCDQAGRVVLRNRQTLELETARQAASLVAAAVDELLDRAREGDTATRTLELLGPPPRTLVITANALHHDGDRVGTVAVIDDVSERQRLEAVRRDFVANVGHELRTPIGALAVLAETLSEEDDLVVVRRLAARISAEAERAGRLIEDLLDLSRIEAEGSTTAERVSVAAVLADAAERVRQAAEGRQVRVQLPDCDPAPEVTGDRGQLVSAVVNLLDNAIKYSDAGSTVLVAVHRRGGWVEVAVRDEGIGIPGRDLERIFERFYRVDRARSRETGGTGLGLSIVRHVATNHGGDVHVESREGEGSTFTLRLPERR